MDTIIAGRFDSYAAARKAEAVLIGSDFAAADICTFVGGPPETRKTGVLVAVRAEGESAAQSAREIFKQSGASDIEVASGTWRDGTWVDFDPTAPPAVNQQ